MFRNGGPIHKLFEQNDSASVKIPFISVEIPVYV